MSRWWPVAVLALLGVLTAAGSALAAMGFVREDAQRYALLIADRDDGPTARLADTLTERYGFQVAALLGADARLENLEEQFFRLQEQLNPGDSVFLHIALPVTRDEELAFLPTGADPENSWEFLPWRLVERSLASAPSGPVLMTFPGCGATKRSPYGDPMLEEFAYMLDARRDPVEVIMVCDLESMRVQRRNPEERFSPWRGEQVSALLTRLLSATLLSRGADNLSATTQDGRGIVEALGSAGGEGFRFSYLTLPLYEKGVFRFVPVESADAYLSRYENADSARALLEVQQDYQDASSEAADLQAPFIAYSRRVALSARAGAPDGLELEASEILDLRRNAVRALMLRMDDVAARDAMIDIALGASDSSVVRRSAVVNLSRTLDDPRPQDVDALKRAAATDADSFIREAAFVGLAQVNSPDIAQFLASAFQSETDARVKRSLILSLSSIGRDQDVALFIQALGDADAGVRSQAVGALAALPATARINQTLLARLGDDPDAGVRSTIAYALARSTPDSEQRRTVATLVSRLQSDPAAEVRVAAASSLGAIGGGRASAALREALNEDAPLRVQIACAQSLGRLADRRAIPQLQRAANGSDHALKTAAIEALARINTAEAAEVVWQKLETDEDLRVQEAAQKALENMPLNLDTIRGRLRSSLPRVRQTAVAQLSNSEDPEASALLLEALEDDDYRVQQNAIRNLSERELSGYVDSLRDSFDRGNTRVKVNVLDVMARLPGDRWQWIEGSLFVAAQSETPEVRAAAIRALGSQGNEAGLEAIFAATGDRYAMVRVAAAGALAQFSELPEARQRLEELAKGDRDAEVREAAVKALSHRRTSQWGPG